MRVIRLVVEIRRRASLVGELINGTTQAKDISRNLLLVYGNMSRVVVERPARGG